MRHVRFRDPAGSIRIGEWTDEGIRAAGRAYDLDQVDVLPPVEPSKVVCVGFNYEAHLDDPHLEGRDIEVPDRPVLFLKTPNTISGHGDTVTVPEHITVDFEAEIGVVIREQCKYISEEEAMDVVRGFTCVNDLSNHNEMDDDEYLVRVKAFDNAAPMGPVIASPDRVPAEATIELRVNGETRQHSDRSKLIFSIPEIIADISQYLTLEPGDVIATGSPAGSAPLEPGDEVEIEIEGIGTLKHRLTKEKR